MCIVQGEMCVFYMVCTVHCTRCALCILQVCTVYCKRWAVHILQGVQYHHELTLNGFGISSWKPWEYWDIAEGKILLSPVELVEVIVPHLK